MIAAANRWQSEIRKPADGVQFTGAGNGTSITAGGAAHTKGAWVDVIAAADWAGFVGDAFDIEIWFNTVDTAGTSGENHRLLGDLGIDTGGGYAVLIEDLSALNAPVHSILGDGPYYRFPVRVPNGAKVGFRIQSNTASESVFVAVNVFGNPSHPALVRAGTFVRTFGADTANTNGTAITTGAAAEGAWTEIEDSTADDLWFWDFGYSATDTAFSGGVIHIDLATGAAGAEVAFARQLVLTRRTDEAVAKPRGGVVFPVASGTRISARMQGPGSEVGDSVIVYAVGGSYQLPGVHAVAGTVEIDGFAAANGNNVSIFAIDSDFIAELVAITTIAGGAGAFTVNVPDNVRSYLAYYQDGAIVGASVPGTPGADTFDITIFTGGGGGAPDVTPPTITVVSPTPGVAPGDPGGFPADPELAKHTPIVIDLEDAGGGLAYAAVFARFNGSAVRVPIFRRGAFEPGYAVHSTLTVIDPETWQLSIRADAGWPTFAEQWSLAFDADLIDTGGNVT